MRMKANKGLSLAILGWSCCLITSAACGSVSVPARNDPREPTLALTDVDSQVFAAVVRGQLDGGDDAYPYRLTRFRYDSRPYGTNSGYPEVFAGIQGIDPSLSFPRASQSDSEIQNLIQTRKRILQRNGVRDGERVSYPQCAVCWGAWRLRTSWTLSGAARSLGCARRLSEGPRITDGRLPFADNRRGSGTFGDTRGGGEAGRRCVDSPRRRDLGGTNRLETVSVRVAIRSGSFWSTRASEYDPRRRRQIAVRTASVAAIVVRAD